MLIVGALRVSTVDLDVPTSSARLAQTTDVLIEPWGSTLLLIEDDPAEREKLQSVLRRLPAGQYHVTHVDTLSAAQEALTSQDFSVVLLDLSLQGASGLSSIRALQAIAPAVPIVVLGGWNDQNLALEAVRAGAQDFMMKRDVDPARLDRSLRFAIEKTRAEGRLAHLAHYDQLTQLANRTLFRQRLEHALANAEFADERVALVYISVDCFEEVSEAFGADISDGLLREVAVRLQGIVRDTETVARLGGSEFCIIVGGVRRPNDAEAVAHRALAALAEPFEGVPIQLSGRVGISVSGERSTVEGLLEKADAARLRAVSEGHERIRIDGSNGVEVQTARLRRALEDGELRLVYQPRLSLDYDRISGVEAYLRWDDPERGLLCPRDFLDACDGADLTLELGDWTLFEAAREAVKWRADGRNDVPVAVNLTAPQIAMPDLARHLVGVVRRAGAEPDWIELDCAESLLMDNPARSRDVLQSLQDAGFRTAIDDFGAGFGHLAELARLPLDTLKIDRSVVEALEEAPARRALVAAAVALGRELALEVVAEGVELDAQVKVLRTIGATSVQGFWLAQPKSPSAFNDWAICRWPQP